MNLFFLGIGILLIIYIVRAVMNKTFDIYESIFWILATVLISGLAMFPKSLDSISLLVGISYSPSLVFLLGLVFLLFINFKHGRILTSQKEKITELAQKVAILENQIQENGERDHAEE